MEGPLLIVSCSELVSLLIIKLLPEELSRVKLAIIVLWRTLVELGHITNCEAGGRGNMQRRTQGLHRRIDKDGLEGSLESSLFVPSPQVRLVV